MRFATATCGFGPMKGNAEVLGLVPPTLGCEWHDPQELLLNVGPSPPLPGEGRVTPSTSVNWAMAVWKNRIWSPVRLAMGWPAPTVPPRGPGSTACPCAVPVANTSSITRNSKLCRRIVLCALLLSSPVRFATWFKDTAWTCSMAISPFRLCELGSYACQARLDLASSPGPTMKPPAKSKYLGPLVMFRARGSTRPLHIQDRRLFFERKQIH